MRSIPWVRDVIERHHAKGLSAIGIHTPEFDHERDRAAVEREVARHGLRDPQLLDNDAAYWNALQNQYWPAFYLVDQCGRIRAQLVGEAHSGEPRTEAFETKLRSLLDEQASACD